MDTPTVLQALDRAIKASEEVAGTTSPNPPVGAVILDASEEIVGIGATQPVGGAHAEVVALRAAGERARGGTAVVTLEPCDHTGRTGPCSQALIDAGIRQVYYVHPDPTPQAQGGAQHLRSVGVKVTQLAGGGDSRCRVNILAPWLKAVRQGRPAVTLKCAQSLDGFTAALDGSSQWITSSQARDFVHRDRATRDAIIVGTSTVLMDNPRLTARRSDGTLYPHQPLRGVIGSRQIVKGHLADTGFVQWSSPETALADLWNRGARNVLVEGGPQLAVSFLRAGLVDFVQAYVAPLLLGDGRPMLGGALAHTLADGLRMHTTSVQQLGEDVLLCLEVSSEPL